MFDAAVGNPPFVRYQFLNDQDIEDIQILGLRIGIPFRGVSNLWIPLWLGALSRIRQGGAMAFVVPAELFTGMSAGVARTWLLQNVKDLRVEMFGPGSFPDVLQEVIVVSGTIHRSSASSSAVTLREHGHNDLVRSVTTWAHDVPLGPMNWTKYLLMPSQLSAWDEVACHPKMKRLRTIAKMEVSIVTGANRYFSVSDEEAECYRLADWCQPLLDRIRRAEGLVFAKSDHDGLAQPGVKRWLLDFDARRPDPMVHEGARGYLARGEREGIPYRYKTSIRSPWYRVPSVRSGTLMLSKRSHRYPRLLFNAAGVMTTDTVYRGWMREPFAGREAELVAGFHNSVSLLSAELEGRSFGGGVLELVPSELNRLLVPFDIDLAPQLASLDALARRDPDERRLVEATDMLLAARLPDVSGGTLVTLREAWSALVERRLKRNGPALPDPDTT